ncbi:MAG: serine/threonine-protein kinase, partial [Isosphaeraceae bacterium]
AIKLIREGLVGDPTTLSRFQREVQTTAMQAHPNTVRIYDYGIADDGTFYYTMEYLPGLTLQELVQKFGPLPPERPVYFLRRACSALQEAHGMGLIHRDLKPGNLIASELGGILDVLKLLDFGLVHATPREPGWKKLSFHGFIAGTPAYLSPEQAAGRTEVDARSDIYSLGAVGYFLLAGRPRSRPTRLTT